MKNTLTKNQLALLSEIFMQYCEECDSSKTTGKLVDAIWEKISADTNEQELAIKCAHADLVGALQALESGDIHSHDWKAHKQSIDDLETQFDFIEKV